MIEGHAFSRFDRAIQKYINARCPPQYDCRRWAVGVLSQSNGRGLSTPLIKSQMNDISGAIISYRYYCDGYYVSRGARAFSLRSSLCLSYPLRLFLYLSLYAPLSLSISLLLFLLLLLLPLETLLLLHARNQVTALQESKSREYTRERGLVLSNIYLYPPEKDDD